MIFDLKLKGLGKGRIVTTLNAKAPSKFTLVKITNAGAGSGGIVMFKNSA